MTIRPDLLEFAQPIETIPGGFVQLVDVMGDDARIASSARISTGAEQEEERNRRLIRYLLRNDPPHGSPLEFCEVHLKVKVPLYVWAQWVRYRTANINQMSMRSSNNGLPGFYSTPQGQWRRQTDENKMGSKGLLCEVEQARASSVEEGAHAAAEVRYNALIHYGMAHEQARKLLTQDAWTTAHWKIDLRNLLFGFLRQRLDPHAQEEIRTYAQVIAEIVKVWVPMTWEAFVDYHLEARKLSRMELRALALVMAGERPEDAAREQGMVKSERARFAAWADELVSSGAWAAAARGGEIT